MEEMVVRTTNWPFTDFIYDDIRLSDLGFMVCQFDETGGFKTSSAGSKLNFTKVAQNHGKNHLMSGAKYDECFEADISICKQDGTVASVEEYAALLRWLNRTEYHDLYIGYVPDTISTTLVTTVPEYLTTLEEEFINVRVRVESDYDEIHYRGTFNVDKVEFRGRIVGFTLHFTSDGPFGYGNQRTLNFSVTVGTPYTLEDKSDEVGYLYPDHMEITCNGSGNLVLTNSIEDRRTAINNVTTGETIVFDNMISTISSSLVTHNVMNDFNYTFFRIANTYTSRNNVISTTVPCDIELTYTPRRKVVF